MNPQITTNAVAGDADATADETSTPTLTRRILVTVGTYFHRFDRLIQWFDRWVDERDDSEIGVEAIVQRATAAPGRASSVEYFAFDELVEQIQKADIVVTHGGPGSIFEARKWGRLPLVVARDPEGDEHVDNHQQLFAERMAADGQVLLARTEDDFRELLDSLVASPQTVTPHDSQHVEQSVRRIGLIVDRLVLGSKP